MEQNTSNVYSVNDSNGITHLKTKFNGQEVDVINSQKLYKIIGGTAYDLNTNDEVIKVLERVRYRGERIRVYYGDTKTGICWNDEFEIYGYIGRSTGSIIKIPLLIPKRNSSGGGGILDHCIIKIKESKGSKVLYQAPNFKQSVFEIKDSKEDGYSHSLFINGTLYSNHKSLKSAEILRKKLS